MLIQAPRARERERARARERRCTVVRRNICCERDPIVHGLEIALALEARVRVRSRARARKVAEPLFLTWTTAPGFQC